MFDVKEILSKKYVMVSIIAGFLIAVGSVFLFQKEPEAEVAAFSSLTATSTSSEVDSSLEDTNPSKKISEDSAEIWVDVKGAVQKPGLYSLKAGARVNDGIEAAGGLLPSADPKSVNLAEKLTDEGIVYVAALGEEVSVLPSKDGQKASSANAQAEDSTINLNTATIADLTTISGIGEKRANDIIAYRDSIGGFKTVDDLNNVSGIGDKTLENIRPYVSVE